MNHKLDIKNEGFTLIELLVVVAIIGILASVVLASVNTARAKAQTAAVQEEFHQIEEQVNNVRDTQNKVMGLVTGNYCTSCAFSNTSKANTQTAALATNATSWLKLGYSSPPLDPWGTPYSFDENELESGTCASTSKDNLKSAGPDGIFYTSDDLTYSIIYFTCPG